MPPTFLCKENNWSFGHFPKLRRLIIGQERFTDTFFIFIFLFSDIAKKVDSNHDGTISKEELDKWIQDNHMKYLLKNSKEYVVDVDLNNDSMMSFKEYEVFHYVPGKCFLPFLTSFLSIC